MSHPQPRPLHHPAPSWTPNRLLDGAPDVDGLWPANDVTPRLKAMPRPPITGLIEHG
ncbi:MAG: hypothetical protein WDN45_15565 [Caulobacteraceae bacterium]